MSEDGYPQVAQDGSRNIADITDTFGDLDTFRRHGGKLLTFVGANDQLIMPRGVINYYRQMASRYGEHGEPDFERLQRFYRLFRAPGVAHCGGGAGPQPQNLFNTLVNWVENGVAPDQILAQIRRRGNPDASALPLPADGHLQRQREHGRREQLPLRREPREAASRLRGRADEVQARGEGQLGLQGHRRRPPGMQARVARSRPPRWP